MAEDSEFKKAERKDMSEEGEDKMEIEVETPKKKRGRPKKQAKVVDDSMPKRNRGRPKKVHAEEIADDIATPDRSKAAATEKKDGDNRPKRKRIQVVSQTSLSTATPPRKRGRPVKKEAKQAVQKSLNISTSANNSMSSPKQKRGKKRKSALENLPETILVDHVENITRLENGCNIEVRIGDVSHTITILEVEAASTPSKKRKF